MSKSIACRCSRMVLFSITISPSGAMATSIGRGDAVARTTGRDSRRKVAIVLGQKIAERRTILPGSPMT